MSMFTTAAPPEHDVVRRVVDHIAAHLDADLSAGTLAAIAGVSERHLTRLFVEDLGRTPGRYVRDVRTESAAHLLSTTSLTAAQVAKQSGFGSAEALRQAFTARYGVAPSRYRATQAREPG
jgi:transcriptional regulator GlxA family with amidase domain